MSNELAQKRSMLSAQQLDAPLKGDVVPSPPVSMLRPEEDMFSLAALAPHFLDYGVDPRDEGFQTSEQGFHSTAQQSVTEM